MLESTNEDTSKYLIELLNYKEREDSLSNINKGIDDMLIILKNDNIVMSLIKNNDIEFAVDSVYKYISKRLFKDLLPESDNRKYDILSSNYNCMYYNIESKKFTFNKGEFSNRTIMIWDKSAPLNLVDLEIYIGILLSEKSKDDIIKKYIEALDYGINKAVESINELEISFITTDIDEKKEITTNFINHLMNNLDSLSLCSDIFINNFISLVLSDINGFLKQYKPTQIATFINMIMSLINKDNVLIILNEVNNYDISGSQYLLSSMSNELFSFVINEFKIKTPVRFEDRIDILKKVPGFSGRNSFSRLLEYS